MEPTTNKHYFLFFILIVIALEAILFSVGNYKWNASLQNEEMKAEEIRNAFENISIEAQAFSVYDQTQKKKIYGKNDNVTMPIASLTKIMTVAVALNNHSLEDVVAVSPEAIKQDGDYGFFVGEKFKVEELAKFTLVGSVNDGAYLMAEKPDDFLIQMNSKAQRIGMENTLFLNATGLDFNDQFAGAYASAENVNIMALYAFLGHRGVFSASAMPEISIKSESGFHHSIKNTNYITEKISNLLFSKTGFTPLSGGNLTIIYRDKYEHDIVITVLGSTMEGRFSDMEKIIDTLYNLDYGGSK